MGWRVLGKHRVAGIRLCKLGQRAALQHACEAMLTGMPLLPRSTGPDTVASQVSAVPWYWGLPLGEGSRQRGC